MHKLAKSNRKIPKSKTIISKIMKKVIAFLVITKNCETMGLVTPARHTKEDKNAHYSVSDGQTVLNGDCKSRDIHTKWVVI